MRTLFISETYIKENSVIDENTDFKKILPVVWRCQMQYIQNFLGNKLYEHLLAEVEDLIDNAVPLDAVDKTLLDDYVSDALLYWIMYEVQLPLLYEFRNKNVSKVSGDNAQPVDFKEHRYIKDEFKQQAEFFSVRLTDYLCANEELYPTFNTEDDFDQVRPEIAKPTVSVYLGGSRGNDKYCASRE